MIFAVKPLLIIPYQPFKKGKGGTLTLSTEDRYVETKVPPRPPSPASRPSPLQFLLALSVAIQPIL